MRDVLNIEDCKIVAPAWHVRQDTAHFSSLHPKKQAEANLQRKASEPQNSQVAVARLLQTQ